MVKVRRNDEEPKREAVTGKFFGIGYKPHEGFPNFEIVTLDIKDGVVVSKTGSDPYNKEDLLQRLELALERHFDELRRSYPVATRWG